MDVRSLVNDARVLLGQLQRSQWGDLHVRTPNGEIFIAKHGGRVDPIRRAVPKETVAPVTGEPGTEVAERLLVRAPHVASVVAVLPAWTEIPAGAVVCRLAVLGQTVEIFSPQDGVIGEVFVGDGALVEYESPLFEVVRSQ